MASSKPVTAAVIYGDTHIGCKLGLCPPWGYTYDQGGARYLPSKLQQAIWGKYEEFFTEFVPKHVAGHKFVTIHMGDQIDGKGVRGATHQWSHNLYEQQQAAEDVLEWTLKQNPSPFYQIRGTEVHDGIEHVQVESIAKNCGAVPNDVGQYSRNSIMLKLGGWNVHCSHHVSQSGMVAGKPGTIARQIANACESAARWSGEKPDLIVRGHAHSWALAGVSAKKPTGEHYLLQGIVLGSWQAKTPYAHRLPNLQFALPEFGAVVVTANENGLSIHPFVSTIDTDDVVIP